MAFDLLHLYRSGKNTDRSSIEGVVKMPNILTKEASGQKNMNEGWEDLLDASYEYNSIIPNSTNFTVMKKENVVLFGKKPIEI